MVSAFVATAQGERVATRYKLEFSKGYWLMNYWLTSSQTPYSSPFTPCISEVFRA